MILKLTNLLLVCILTSQAFTQTKNETFQIILPETKVPGSLYNSIHLVDIRQDTTSLGLAQKGAFNKLVNVIPEIPLSVQFTKILNSLTDKSAKEGELVLLLRQLSFAEITKAMSEFGYCHFRAVLFAKYNDGYRKLERIDTVVLIRAMDVTKKMFKEGSKVITEFVHDNLTRESTSDIILSLDQLSRIDSFEKSKIPLYSTTRYTDGLYYSYQSFSKQHPDETDVIINFDKKGRVQKISYVNKKGEKWDIENRFIYAFVYGGKPYISGEFTCYPLEKRGEDFYFTGKVNNAKNTDVAAATYFFGIMGALMASSSTAIVEMKIDHLTGGFITGTNNKY